MCYTCGMLVGKLFVAKTAFDITRPDLQNDGRTD